MPNILIIDDDPTIRTMYGRALKALGEVDLAPNGAEALKMFAVKKYQVILLDLHMPSIDGFDLLETLAQKEAQNHDTPVFVVTADTSDQARVRAARKHAVFLLTKPVPIASLVSLVDSALKKAQARADGEPAAKAPKKA
jgi:CheY-like chemotaxis protein